MNRSVGPVVRSERSVTCCEHTDDQEQGILEEENLIISGSHHYNNQGLCRILAYVYESYLKHEIHTAIKIFYTVALRISRSYLV
jgi:hypothetical protein